MNQMHDLRTREFSLHQLNLFAADLDLAGEPQPCPDDWVTLDTPVVGPWSRPDGPRVLEANVLYRAGEKLRLILPPPGLMVVYNEIPPERLGSLLPIDRSKPCP